MRTPEQIADFFINDTRANNVAVLTDWQREIQAAALQPASVPSRGQIAAMKRLVIDLAKGEWHYSLLEQLIREGSAWSAADESTLKAWQEDGK